jgi:hypothetical protein
VIVVERGCCAPQQGSRCLQRRGHVGEREPHGGLVEQGAAERLPVGQITRRLVERGLRAAQRACGDVQSAAVEPVHRDAEPGAFAVRPAQHRVGGHPNAFEDDLRGRLRVPAHLLLVGTETQSGRALFDYER